MAALKKYRRIYRICPKGMDIPPKKKCLSDNDIKILLDGDIVVEEKIDGGIVGISWDHYNYRHMAIGKHNPISTNENSKRFYGFNKWVYDNYEKVQKIPQGWTIFGKWMRSSHNIFYDLLPDYFMAFDIWDGYRYIDFDNKEKLLELIGFKMISTIYIGRVKGVKDIIGTVKKSQYSSFENMEGVVVKNYKKGLMGKFVTREFDDRMDEHWLEKPLIENRLASFKDKKNKDKAMLEYE